MEDEEQIPVEVQKLFDRKAERQANRKKLREENLKAKDNYAKLDLSKRVLKLQLVQKFLNKLKASRQLDRETVVKEIDNFNLEIYINEITVSIADQKITEEDIQYFLQVCSKLHQSYVSFQGMMATQIYKQLSSTGISLKEKDPQIAADRKKGLMNLLGELFVVGLTEITPDRLFESLQSIIEQKDRNSLVLALPTAVMFSEKFGFEILRKRSRKLNKLYNKYDDLQDIFQFDQILPHDRIVKNNFNLQLYATNLLDPLRSLYDAKVRYEQKFDSVAVIEDGASAKDEEKYKNITASYVSLLEQSKAFADNLDLEFEICFGNELQMKKKREVEQEKWRKEQDRLEKERIENQNIFDTKQERAFYEDIFDLKAKLPKQIFETNSFPSLIEQRELEEAVFEIPDENLFKPDETYSLENIPETYQQFRRYLVECTNGEKADILAEQFMYINTPLNRKRLSYDILHVPGDFNLLVPNLGRLVAVINFHFKDVGTNCLAQVEKVLENLKINNKYDSTNKEKSLKLLCELAKFEIVPIFKPLNIFKLLVDSFNSSVINLLQSFIEQIGRYMFNSEETNLRYTNITQNLLALLDDAKIIAYKKTRIQKEIQNTQISKQQINYDINKQSDELSQFVQFLVQQKLQPLTFSDVDHTLQNLPWSQELEQVLQKSILILLPKKQSVLSIISFLIKSISISRPSFSIQLIDSLVELIKESLEVSESKILEQSAIGSTILLAHLHQQGLFSEESLFELLYFLIKEKNSEEQQIQRITLVSSLIETLQLQQTSQSKIILFLIYLKKYTLSANTLSEHSQVFVSQLSNNFDQTNRISRITKLEESQELVQIIEDKQKNNQLESVEDELKIFVGKILQKQAKQNTQIDKSNSQYYFFKANEKVDF